MSKERVVQISVLDSCKYPNLSGGKECLNIGFPLKSAKTAIEFAKTQAQILPEIKGRIYIEGSDLPASKELPACEMCQFKDWKFKKI